MLRVTKVLTADNTDALAGTMLQSIPEDGLLGIWAGSTQADTLITVTIGGNIIVNAQPVTKRSTDGVPNISDDPPYLLPVLQGQRPVINVDVVTAATVVVVVEFGSEEELSR